MKSKQSIGFYQKIIYRFLSLLLIFQYHVCEQCTVNITASFVGGGGGGQGVRNSFFRRKII